MDKHIIKKQLLNYNRDFKQMSGTFDSFLIVHKYINFLKTELFTKNLLKPISSDVDKEFKIMEKINPEKFSINTSDLEVEKIPIFQNILSKIISDKNNPNGPDLSILLPIYLTLLSTVYFKIEEIIEQNKKHNKQAVSKLIDYLKKVSFSLPSTDILKDNNYKKMIMGQHLDIAMEQINKYIIDEIDSQLLLEDNNINNSIFYDKDNCILHIRDISIKIQLKSQPPVEHYILKTIFEEDDITRKVSFYDIAECEGDEYVNNWNRYRNACDKLQNKISKQSNNIINDFIYYKTGIDGWCKINKKYL